MTVLGSGEVKAIAMINRNLGGGDYWFNPATGEGQQGVCPRSGSDSSVSVDLNNIGLLVRCWGRVTHTGGSFMYINDGSALADGSGYTGVRVETDHLATGNTIEFPNAEAYVHVTGISSCRPDGLGNLTRVLRPRVQTDIVSTFATITITAPADGSTITKPTDASILVSGTVEAQEVTIIGVG